MAENHPKVRFFLAMGGSGPYSETDFIGGEEFFRRQNATRSRSGVAGEVR
jgi:hypothetical protein